MKRLLIYSVLTCAALGASGVALARTNIDVNIGVPGFVAPPPVVYAPPAYAPPPPPPPVVVGPPAWRWHPDHRWHGRDDWRHRPWRHDH